VHRLAALPLLSPLNSQASSKKISIYGKILLSRSFILKNYHFCIASDDLALFDFKITKEYSLVIKSSKISIARLRCVGILENTYYQHLLYFESFPVETFISDPKKAFQEHLKLKKLLEVNQEETIAMQFEELV
jgi:hypothetical protein